MFEMKIPKKIWAIWIIGIVVELVIVIGTLYVTWHFISKYW